MSDMATINNALSEIHTSIETCIKVANENGESPEFAKALQNLQTSVKEGNSVLSGVNIHKLKANKVDKVDKEILSILTRILFLKNNFNTFSSKHTQQKIGAIQSVIFSHNQMIDSIHRDIQDLHRIVKELNEKSKKVEGVDGHAL